MPYPCRTTLFDITGFKTDGVATFEIMESKMACQSQIKPWLASCNRGVAHNLGWGRVSATRPIEVYLSELPDGLAHDCLMFTLKDSGLSARTS